MVVVFITRATSSRYCIQLPRFPARATHRGKVYFFYRNATLTLFQGSQQKNVISMREFWLCARPQVWKIGGNLVDSGNQKGYELCMLSQYSRYDIFKILHTTTMIPFAGISFTLVSKPRRHVKLGLRWKRSSCAVNGDSLKFLFNLLLCP